MKTRDTVADLLDQYVLPITFRASAVVLIIGVGGFILWLVSRGISARPRPGTLVAFEDLSAPRSERLEKSTILTRAFLDAMQNPAFIEMSALSMDILPGIDEPGFGGLQHTLAMVALPDYQLSDHPVKIASVEFSVRDFIALATRMWTRPHKRRLEGWLSITADSVEMGARLLDSVGRPIDVGRRRGLKVESSNELLPQHYPCEWRVSRTGVHAREDAIADLAAKVVVDTGGSKLTNSWQSFRHFREALRLRQDQRLEPSASNDAIAYARQHLEDAIAHDPANWMARFQLALILCRDGDSAIALAHFELLEQLLGRAWPVAASAHTTADLHSQCANKGPAFLSVANHLKHYPECAFLILYNKAVAFASRDDAGMSEAGDIFTQISRLYGADTPRFSSPFSDISKLVQVWQKMELRLYALSALANLIARDKGNVLRLDGLDPGATKVEQIQTIQSWIERLCGAEVEAHWKSLSTARAVTLTALATVYQDMDEPQFDLARRKLEEALAAEPHMVEASLLLAKEYMQMREPWSLVWAARAEELLKRVLEIYPSCRQAADLRKELHKDERDAKAADRNAKMSV
jgi:hypothetical protein